MQYRTRPRIISEVLMSAGSSLDQDGATVSSLMRRCNLSYNRMEALLAQLVRAGLLNESPDPRSPKYTLSPRGSDYLRLYREFESFVEAFGLGL